VWFSSHIFRDEPPIFVDEIPERFGSGDFVQEPA